MDTPIGNGVNSLYERRRHPIFQLAVTTKSRPKVYRRYFVVDLPKPSNIEHPVHFTFKYRTTIGHNWRWASEVAGSSDGELFFQTPTVPTKIGAFLNDYDSSLKIQSVASESPGVQLWSIVAPIKGVQGKHSEFTRTSLGTPSRYTRWFAITRESRMWLSPDHGQAPYASTRGAIMCSFLRTDGLHLVLLAISGVKDVLIEFKPDGHGNVVAESRNEREGSNDAHIVAAAATTFDSASAAVMYHARTVVAGDDFQDRKDKLEMERRIADDIQPQWMENWYDGLTYCTWNALGQDLTEDKIFTALADLKKNEINVTNLIIDDNWQSLKENESGSYGQADLGWTDFEANPKGFPKGLKYTATTIRQLFPNIEHIGVWHAILGYWGAVHPDGWIARNYKTKTIKKWDGTDMTVVDEPDISRMYDDFYKFLLESGVDSVKTDDQVGLDEIRDAPDRRRFITAYQDAWVIAALRHFSIKAISCMSQFPQNLFHTQLPTNKPRFMVRNNDDFFPDIDASHAHHIFVNAHNTLFTSHLNILPDWDMFQTHHQWGTYHGAGRCISGGPIYITDEPGKHNMDLIHQMTAQDTHGKTIVLRPSVIGKSIDVYTARHEERLLRVGSFTGGKNGTGLLALFNVNKRALSELVHLDRFPGVEQSEEYVIRAHTTGEVSPPVSLTDKLPVVSVEIEYAGWEILSAYQVRSFTLAGSTGAQHDRTKVAVLGLLGKMTGAAAVLKKETTMHQDSRLKISTSLRALGVLGIYISGLAEKTVEDNFMVLLREIPVPQHTVRINRETSVLEIDVETAFKEMKIGVGYGNVEVVEVFVR
ncbi:uncharacterized protein KY384_001850 [Bacidia gigantensis]|uniref:uncharacterized protein n=1 Tax=Bacidia gigantensis TaxID=2732470 RepID=UPI001D059755|nr:uncharacterized protein KY384_001850 [Bacidia gigantensis]KAG8533067.1 hypothetical protein KY384_001850 [Bacidia gigantensis]